MTLNHLNLTVPDVPRTRAFFENYFHFQCVAERQSDDFVVMVDESGFILTLNNFAKAKEVAYPGAFHVGFRQESREQVNAFYKRLKADGFEIKPPHEFHGGWTIYFRAPGGFLVEIFHQPGIERNDGDSLAQAAGTEKKWANQSNNQDSPNLTRTAMM